MPYKVGVSSGAFGPAAVEEKPRLLGFYKKAQYCITQGVQFVQIDLESISELDEPGLEEKMKKDIVEKLGIVFGIHSETKAFGVEAAELDSAIRMEYERAHKRLIEILEKSGKLGSKYLLIHSSESDPFPLLALRTQPADLVDFYGRSFSEFLKEYEWLLDWVMGEGEWKGKKGGKFIWVEIIREDLDAYLDRMREDYIEAYKMEYREEPPKEKVDERIRMIRKRLRRMFVDEVSSRALHYGPERWAYYLIARWMEKEQKPLWKKIIDINLKFFAERDKKAVEEWASEKNINLQKLSIDDENFRNFHELWVPAVSAQYIWGHMNPELPRYPDPKPIIKKYRMPLVFEPPMGGRGIEEWLRFYNPAHVYPLCEEVGLDYLQLAFDLEHMISIRLDPKLVIKLLPENAGKFVKAIHAGWPSPLAPAHVPIPLGSEQQQYLYRVYYALREKGFGLDPKIDHFILFERGPFPIRETIITLRKIAEFLEKDVKPEDLVKYPEFFGIAKGEVASFERQLTTIKEHAEEPLKGVIAIPEEEYTALGRAAMAKPGVPPEKWKKEELR